MKIIKEKKYILNLNIKSKGRVFEDQLKKKNINIIKRQMNLNQITVSNKAEKNNKEISEDPHPAYAVNEIFNWARKIGKKSASKAEHLTTRLAAKSVKVFTKAFGGVAKAAGSSLVALIGVGGSIFICVFLIFMLTISAIFGGSGGTPDVFAIPFDTSVNSIVITDDFGPRIDPINGEDSFHHGIDYALIWHSPILASANGIVIFVGANGELGNYIILKHEMLGTTMYTLYGHLSEIIVKAGDIVIQGQMIGLEGGEPLNDPNPGASTGDHLHFGMMDANKGYLDPAIFLQNCKF